MYNEQVKLAFIEKYTTSEQTRRLLLHIFDGTQDVEEKYGVDFYAMNEEQAQEAFNLVSGTKVNGASAILVILRSYVRWCVANGYPASKAIQKLRIDVHDKIRASYVGSPHHLELALDEAFPHPEDNEIEYIYRSFLWLGFMGLQVSEAIQVTDDELDFTGLHLYYPPGTEEPYAIYPEAVPDLKKAKELSKFKEPRGKNGIEKQRAAGHEILRGKISDKTLAEAIELTFRPTISRAFKAAIDRYESRGEIVPTKLSLKLTFKHVYLSGIFYREYEHERIGIPPDFSKMVINERRNAKKVQAFSRNYTERKYLNALIDNMEQDYYNWKSVFS